MPDEMTQHSLSERLVRMEGKLDAYAAGQSARLDNIDRRLDQHDKQIEDLRDDLIPVKTSPWVIVGTIVGAVVGLGSMLTLLITLMRIIPDIP